MPPTPAIAAATAVANESARVQKNKPAEPAANAANCPVAPCAWAMKPSRPSPNAARKRTSG